VPVTLSQLTDAERSRLLALLGDDSDAAEQEKFAWHSVCQAFLDPLVEGYALLFLGFAFVLYTLSLFMVRFQPFHPPFVKKLNLPQPTIITNLGFATWRAQLYVDLPI